MKKLSILLILFLSISAYASEQRYQNDQGCSVRFASFSQHVMMEVSVEELDETFSIVFSKDGDEGAIKSLCDSLGDENSEVVLDKGKVMVSCLNGKGRFLANIDDKEELQRISFEYESSILPFFSNQNNFICENLKRVSK